MLIFLTGFMCSGKTTDGRTAAERLKIPFLDLDEELEKHAKQSIRTLIETQGIASFRKLETEILLQTRQYLKNKLAESYLHTKKPEAIIATGGGSILIPENRNYLMQPDNMIIWLDPPFTILLDRIRDNARPLLKGMSEEEIYNLYLERRPYYQMTATHQITSLPVAEQIITISDAISI